jgi:hypothetical protein
MNNIKTPAKEEKHEFSSPQSTNSEDSLGLEVSPEKKQSKSGYHQTQILSDMKLIIQLKRLKK